MMLNAYYAAIAADDAWQAALVKRYAGYAGDARYDARGVATPELARLLTAKLAADAARYALVSATWRVSFAEPTV